MEQSINSLKKLAFNVRVDLYKMGRQKTIQWGGENVYIGAVEKM